MKFLNTYYNKLIRQIELEMELLRTQPQTPRDHLQIQQLTLLQMELQVEIEQILLTQPPMVHLEEIEQTLPMVPPMAHLEETELMEQQAVTQLIKQQLLLVPQDSMELVLHALRITSFIVREIIRADLTLLGATGRYLTIQLDVR